MSRRGGFMLRGSGNQYKAVNTRLHVQGLRQVQCHRYFPFHAAGR